MRFRLIIAMFVALVVGAFDSISSSEADSLCGPANPSGI